ncbi:MAG: integrin [Myxococcota bacterium]
MRLSRKYSLIGIWLGCASSCFAPRLPDEDPEQSIELSVEAGVPPKTVRFVWDTSALLRNQTESHRLEIDRAGNEDYETLVGSEELDSNRTEVDIVLPTHLLAWSTLSFRVVALDRDGGVVATSDATHVTSSDLSANSTGYFKASNPGEDDRFGAAVALAGDSATLIVGAPFENSLSQGINGSESADDEEDASGAVYLFRRAADEWFQDVFIKASNSDALDRFGTDVDISEDGSILIVGASFEKSLARGVDGNERDNRGANVGAAYVFEDTELGWRQTAYLKPSNTVLGQDFRFGTSVALSSLGTTIAVGAGGEASGATGINQDEFNTDAIDAGSVYVFQFQNGSWRQEAYLKASNTDSRDFFGSSLALSGDGRTLVVASTGEASAGRGVNTDQLNNDAPDSGAVYVFIRRGTGWMQEAYIKASNAEAGDRFGESVAVSDDGNRVAIGAQAEDGGVFQTDTGGDDNSAEDAGAVYVFHRSMGTWSQEAYLKASNGRSLDNFGRSVSLSSNGEILAVGARAQNGGAAGVDGDRADETAQEAGAVYVFQREGTSWLETNFVKSSEPDAGDLFGSDVSLSSDGESLAVGATNEDSGASGINGDDSDNSVASSGAVYLY